MFFDVFNTTGVTTNEKGIKKGNIYVDLSNKRDNSKLYDVHRKGASLIFTSNNVTDPNLPVVKVKDSYEALFSLLDNYYAKPYNKLKLIGVVGNSQKETIVDMLSCIFNSIRCEDLYKQSSSKIETMYYIMSGLVDKGRAEMPITLDFSSRIDSFLTKLKFDFGIIASADTNDMLSSDIKRKRMIDFYSAFPSNRPILVNVDEEYSLQLLEENNQSIIMTYGLSKKANIQATSIDITDSISFNYCLQSSLVTSNGRIVEPFEMPIRMKFSGEENIHNALAAITCAMYYDYDIEYIKEVLRSYEGVRRRFETIYKGMFTIIDSYCCLPSDFTNAFNSTMHINFNKLLPIISLCLKDNNLVNEQNVGVIIQWCKILDVKEIILTSFKENIENEDLAPIKVVKYYKKRLEENNISVKYYESLKHSMKYALKKVREKDLILLLGGDELENCKTIVKNIVPYN